MKNNIPTILATALVIAIGFVGGYIMKPETVIQTNLGSVGVTGEYHATLTGEASGTLNSIVLRTVPGTLGSIVITGVGAGVITIYNATTSDVNLRAGATSTLQVLASIPASLAVGTYTFDVIGTVGLLLDIVGVQPTTTITYR